jgi:hypothetical protein
MATGSHPVMVQLAKCVFDDKLSKKSKKFQNAS